MTLLERLEKMAVTDTGPLKLNAGGDELLAPCKVVSRPDRLILQPAGEASFEPHSGVLKPAAQSLMARLAGYLLQGQSNLEIRGYADGQPIPEGVPYRDAWDLSYQRARAAADVLIRRGVAADRVCVVAMGNRNAEPGSEDSPTGAAVDRCRLEIVIQAAADERSAMIAGKEQVNNGQ
jgi:flagellar motor protein MotB